MGNKPTSEPGVWGQFSKAEDVAKFYKDSCIGKYIIVTGGNSGVGLEAVRVLALNGAKVVLCSRNVKNGDDAIADIKSKHPDENVDITTMQLDLGSFKSIYAFAEEYKATGKPLNILINNAGIMACPKAETTDGFESQFGVNHLGHFLLTKEVLPLLIASGTTEVPSRVVNLSSIANIIMSSKAGIKFDDLEAKESYNSFERYGESKLANILFSKELTRRMVAENHNVISMSLHPGSIPSTNLNKYYNLGNIIAGIGALWRSPGGSEVLKESMKDIPQGASTTIVAALSPNVVPGAYYSDCVVNTTQVHATASDDEVAKKLWDVSEELIASKKV